MFRYGKSVYAITSYGEYDKSKKEIWYCTRDRLTSKWVKVDTAVGTMISKGGAKCEPYVRWIRKSLINRPDAVKYVTRWPLE